MKPKKYSLEVIKEYVTTSPSLGDVLYFLESGLDKTKEKLKKKKKKEDKKFEKGYNKLVSNCNRTVDTSRFPSS